MLGRPTKQQYMNKYSYTSQKKFRFFPSTASVTTYKMDSSHQRKKKKVFHIYNYNSYPKLSDSNTYNIYINFGMNYIRFVSDMNTLFQI